MTPSIDAHKAAMEESIKHQFITQGKSLEALSLAEFYSRGLPTIFIPSKTIKEGLEWWGCKEL